MDLYNYNASGMPISNTRAQKKVKLANQSHNQSNELMNFSYEQPSSIVHKKGQHVQFHD